ncbi:unnamed protein product [Closterium sp. NIES-53]
MVFPLRSKSQVVDVLIPWIQLRERFRQDLCVLRLHSDRVGEFSSDLLRDFCRGEGIFQSFTLLDYPKKNGIAKRRIDLVMEVARTSMINAAATHFLWLFAVRYVAHQLNLCPRVSLPETSHTLRWTGKVGDASVFPVWDSRAFVRDTSADKLSARAIPYVFLGFSPDAPGCRFPFTVSSPTALPLPHPPPLFLAPGPPPVDPLPPKGPAPSGVSQVDPLPGTAPVEVAVGSGGARGAASGGAEPGGAESEGAGSGGAEPGVEPGGAESEGAEFGGAEPRGTTSSRGLLASGGPTTAIRNHVLFAECSHFGQHRSAQALYDAVVARYSSPTNAALGRLLLPYLFPEVSSFATVEDRGVVFPAWGAAALVASEFALPGTAPAESLHTFTLDSARVSGKGRERYFLLVVDDYTRYTTVFPLRSKGEVLDVLIPWIRAVRLQLRERFRQELPVLHLHSDRGGEFSSDLLWDFCRGEGILQSFTLPTSPQQNGIAERRIGLCQTLIT